MRGLSYLALPGVRLPPSGAVMWFWHWLVHVTGSDYGLQAGRWSFYGFFSGFGSDLGEITIIAGLLAIYKKHNCHVARCWRLGRHAFTDEATGASYLLCRRHHPAVPDEGLTPEMVNAIASRGRGSGPGRRYHGHGENQA